MDLYAKLKLIPIRTEPDLWVRRMAFFKSITPAPTRIRNDVVLSKGVNIVWAEEPENDDPAAEITGHSVGKTTFCRFLRYVLGERTFGTKVNMDLIGKAFPQGYVGAELFVKKQPWAVLRPIGNGHASYVMANALLEGLLKGKGETAFLSDYEKKLGLDGLLEGIETAQIVKTGETIEWRQVLAWCTRDQEARFQSIHEWRSTRSEADTPAFNFPKGGPLFVMRAVLGLFLPEELKAEEELAGRQVDVKKFAKELEALEREPQFRVNLAAETLRAQIRKVFPDHVNLDKLPLHADDLLPDLSKLTTKAGESIELGIAAKVKEFDAKQSEIDDISGAILESEDELKMFDTLYGVDEAAKTDKAKDRDTERSLHRKYRTSDCLLGGVPYKECTFVQRRQQALQVTELQDARILKQRSDEQARINAQKTQIRSQIKTLNERRETLRGERTVLDDATKQKRSDLAELTDAIKELSLWTGRLEKKLPFKKLDDCREKIANNESGMKSLETQLDLLIADHTSKRSLLESIFSGAIHEVLTSGTYNGSVTLNERQLGFSITQGPALSGEAVQTLSILLADAVSIVYNTVVENARVPGILLHDSPREADLGLRIYHSFLRFMLSLQSHFAADSCPFQYIVTTTTPPPKVLRKKQFIKLKLGGGVERLLKCNIAEAAKIVEAESKASEDAARKANDLFKDLPPAP